MRARTKARVLLRKRGLLDHAKAMMREALPLVRDRETLRCMASRARHEQAMLDGRPRR